MPSVHPLKVFLSSPDDVKVERNIADAILQELPRLHAWRGKFTFEIVRWDDPHAAVPMDAQLSPQEALNRRLAKPSECDIVVVILWSRMGTPLIEPLKPDGSSYLSGTEWEFDDALKGTGLLLVFRRMDEPLIAVLDPAHEQKAEQYRLVAKFFEGFNSKTGSATRSINFYTGEQEFAGTFRQKIEGVLRQIADDIWPNVVREGKVASLRVAQAEQELPDTPYPLLQPYTHPLTFAGRDEELKRMEQLVRQPQLVLGLHGPSGAGKSSLLLAGLVPRLRATGFPVSIEPRPGEPGLARRLLDDLLELPADGGLADDGENLFDEFALWVDHTRALATGKPPVLILDQMDDVLRLPDKEKDDVLARLGPLMAATARRLPGDGGFRCRWVLCYRHEFHGDVSEWLQDVLKQARSGGHAGIKGLPYNLTGDRFDSWAVPVMGTLQTGESVPDAERNAFYRAITQPLEVVGRDGGPRYALRFLEQGAERLADAFARARQAQPKKPLVPELQVVLSHLIGRATLGSDGATLVTVPDDPADLDQQIDDALAAHLKRAIESAFPLGQDEAAARGNRARALLVLRELADAHGRRAQGLTKNDLAKAFGVDGDRVIKTMESPQVRLIVQEQRAHAFVYVLSHDRMAEFVTRFFESERLLGDLDLDVRVVELRRFVAQRSELYLRSHDRSAIDLTVEQYELILGAADALIRDEGHRQWWEDCQIWFDLCRQLGANPPDFSALVELARGHRGDWGQIGRRVPVADINPKIFWAWSYESKDTITNSVDPVEVLDVIECVHTVLLDSREAFYAMSYAVEELRWRYPEHAERARSLAAKLRAVFCSEHGFDDQLPLFNADYWHLPNELLLGFVHIPEGTFSMGSDKALDPVAYDDEMWRSGQSTVEMPDFYIARYEVTVTQFRTFVDASGFVPVAPESLTGPPYHPVTFVSWYEALQYCAWLEQALKESASTPDTIQQLLHKGWSVRLPSEPEWEKAARGIDGRIYPWGEGIDCGRANHSAAKIDNTSSVGSFPRGSSPYGVLDMSGNVWEWTRSLYKPYPYDSKDGREAPMAGERVLRGGYFGSYEDGVRAARRHRRHAGFRRRNIGFRVVLSRLSDPGSQV
jgi:formylglycine-generating enzyme required for sulfatase activity